MVASRITTRITRSADLGRIISDGRRRANLSQEEFGEKLGVSRKTISDLERGVAEHLSMKTALAALWLAGFQLEASSRRPPTITEVLARRASDNAKSEMARTVEPPTAKNTKRK
jgi:transcriptional regulator with XRE-family HTH domain